MLRCSRRFVRPLSAEAHESVTETYKTNSDAMLVRRCHAVLLSAEGKRVPEIARLLPVDQSSIHRWLDRFEAGGLAGLAPVWGPGRTPRWDEEYEHLLVETVRPDPRWDGLEHSVWTGPLLAGYLARQTGSALSAERVRVLLHQHGIRLKQPPSVVHRRDPPDDRQGRGRRGSA